VTALIEPERRDTAVTAVVSEDAYELHRRGTRQLLVARGCFFASAYVVSAILARRLGPTQYGVYGVVISQLLWLEMVINAGVPAATARLIADGHHDNTRVEGSARALLLGFSLVMVATCWVLAPTIAAVLQVPESAWIFRLAVLDAPLAAAYASYEGPLYGHRRFVVLAVAQGALGILRVAGILALVPLGFSLERVILVIIGSTLAVVAGVGFYFRSSSIRVAPAIVRDLLVMGAPMAVYLIFAQVLVNVDLWMLKSLWTGSSDLVGHYVASGNLARTLAVIPAVQAGVVFVSVAWAVAASDRPGAQRHVQEATRFAMIAVAAAFTILGPNGSAILTTLFSYAYAEGGRFLRLQLAGLGLFALLDVLSSSLMAVGRQRLVATIVVAIAPVSWLLNLLLIPRFGPIGAATSMVCGLALATAITGAVAQRHFGSVLRVATLARVTIAALMVEATSAAWQVQGPVVLLKVVALSVFYLLVLLLLGELTWQDLRLHVKKAAHSSS
jgi:O-antigen/teichoic acid export membrane protein